MTSKLFFCVVEDFDGVISVSSFFGRNKAEEKRNALTCNKEVHHITTDQAAAQRFAARLRAVPPAKV